MNDDTMSAVVAKIANAGRMNIPVDPDVDYKNADGLWMCGKCHTPKESVITFNDGTLVVRCLCDCRREALKRERFEYEKRQREQTRREWLAGYEDMKLENDNGKNPSMGFARKFVANWDMVRAAGYSCTLTGPVGCGKTYTAAAIANAIFDKGARVWMVTSGSLVDAMGFETLEKTLNRLKIFDLVVIDDLGAERDTSYAAQRLLDAVDARVRSELPTIITTNMDVEKPLDDPMMARVMSRIVGFAPVYKCTGDDLRRDKGKDRRAELSKILRGGD